MAPLILINFKTYKEGTGSKAVSMAKLCDSLKAQKVQIAVAVQAVDIYRVTKAVKIPVFAQHMDAVDYGSHTGSILPESLKENGCYGTLLNHAEHRIPPEQIEKAILRARQLGLVTVVCAKDDNEGKALAKFSPDYIAIEPPDLIGSSTLSVSTARPELIKDSVQQIPVPVLVGAGVKSAEDLRIGLSLGAHGVLLASGIMKSADPLQALKDLAKGA